mmetsp:Transcript_16218/g.41973  ORF Transcript_16218/g.41973 Transcript_16218/m.41973 type:complete len:229 (+) Transcript_16218:936-1622(+)
MEHDRPGGGRSHARRAARRGRAGGRRGAAARVGRRGRSPHAQVAVRLDLALHLRLPRRAHGGQGQPDGAAQRSRHGGGARDRAAPGRGGDRPASAAARGVQLLARPARGLPRARRHRRRGRDRALREPPVHQLELCALEAAPGHGLGDRLAHGVPADGVAADGLRERGVHGDRRAAHARDPRLRPRPAPADLQGRRQHGARARARWRAHSKVLLPQAPRRAPRPARGG